MIIGIIQARTGSTRFPNKMLSKIVGKSLLELYIDRVKYSKTIDRIVVATTILSEDDVIEQIAKKKQIDCFRGSTGDLVDRFYQCAKEYKAKIIVRLTPDDCFIDYKVIDESVNELIRTDADFVENHFNPTYPEGLDVEVYTFLTLEKIWREANLLSEREHVFPYIQNHLQKFKVASLRCEKDYSYLRWTIDYPCDLEMAKEVYKYLHKENEIFLQDDIINLLKEKPEIANINVCIKRKEGVNKTKCMEKSDV